MANTKQAKKRASQNERRRERNRSVKTHTRVVVKKLRETAAREPEKAASLLPATASTLDVAVRKGVLHKNTAARLKSRAAKLVARSAEKKS